VKQGAPVRSGMDASTMHMSSLFQLSAKYGRTPSASNLSAASCKVQGVTQEVFLPALPMVQLPINSWKLKPLVSHWW
jgi:hypothetical protein